MTHGVMLSAAKHLVPSALGKKILRHRLRMILMAT